MDKMALPPGLPGFRFHPTDEELITFYLEPKLQGTNPDVDAAIAEVDFYKFDPWELPDKSKIKSRDRMWLFFCRRDYQNTNSKRVKRTTKTGFWKITGKERVIKDQDTKACIGKKRTLVFHLRSAGSGRGERTDWVMHEYFVESDHNFLDQSPHVLCRLKMKGNDMANTPDGNGGEPRGDNITEVENSVMPDANPSAQRMVQTTNPALGVEGFDGPFVPSSNEEVIQMLQIQPLYSPPRFDIYVERSIPRSGGFCHNGSGRQVREEAETRNPTSLTEICFIALLIVTMLFTFVFTVFVGLLVSVTRGSEFSRKRRSFVLLCCVLSCSVAFIFLAHIGVLPAFLFPMQQR